MSRVGAETRYRAPQRTMTILIESTNNNLKIVLGGRLLGGCSFLGGRLFGGCSFLGGRLYLTMRSQTGLKGNALSIPIHQRLLAR